MVDHLLSIWSGALMVLLGVMLGGFMVFRSKRPGEYVLPVKEQQPAGPINIDGLAMTFDDPDEEDEAPGPMDLKAMEQNAKFLAQLAQRSSDNLDQEGATDGTA